MEKPTAPTAYAEKMDHEGLSEAYSCVMEQGNPQQDGQTLEAWTLGKGGCLPDDSTFTLQWTRYY